MNIALDYDGTYTADPELWANFVYAAKTRGHDVTIISMRDPSEPIPDVGCEVRYTSRTAKFRFAKPGSIWIDDQPHFLFTDG